MNRRNTLTIAFFLLSVTCVHAQATFSVQYDTVIVQAVPGSTITAQDDISATTGTVTIAWKVIASDFPADWSETYALCDNNACYTGNGLWTASGGTVATKVSNPYTTSPGNFDMLIGFTASTGMGCHYMTVSMNNLAMPADTAYETYIVCNNTAGTAAIAKPTDDIAVYPNPAHDRINIAYKPGDDVKKIIVYAATGKIMAVYTITCNSRDLNVECLPKGLYFLGFMNSNGKTISTKKIIKE